MMQFLHCRCFVGLLISPIPAHLHPILPLAQVLLLPSLNRALPPTLRHLCDGILVLGSWLIGVAPWPLPQVDVGEAYLLQHPMFILRPRAGWGWPRGGARNSDCLSSERAVLKQYFAAKISGFYVII